ncbi:RNA-binding protein 12B-like [Phyllobates terribilis]|uniref:RNA-binding protein 12B-like n=1 Tax=Phyllobates terribilis TaxID=111132 RepID=UPI003CCB4987
MSQVVRLEGVASAVNLQDLRSHFIGLDIPQGGITIIGGHCGVAYISFSSRVDAQHAVRLSGRSLRGSIVYALRSSISEMAHSLKSFEMSRNGVHKGRDSFTSGHEREGHHSRSPERLSDSSFRKSRSQQWHFRSPQRYPPPEQKYTRSPPWHSRSSHSNSRSPRFRSRSPPVRSRSPRRHRSSSQEMSNDPLYSGDFHVHVTNLNYTTKKKDLRNWFFNLVSEDHIRFLHDEKGRRTRECFVVFQREKDVRRVLQLDKVMLNGRLLFISPISKTNMINMIKGRRVLSSHHSKGKCLLMRNFPPDLKKSDIQKFFAGLALNEEDISLLADKHGVSLGEALVSFSSEEHLKLAEKLHRKKFRDREIKLRRIPEDKLEGFLHANAVVLIPDDPNECVTQEDDLLDEDDTQEYNTPHEDDQNDNIPDEDSGFHQTDNTNECVSQADDAPNESPVQADDDDAIDESPVQADDAIDESPVQADDDPAVQADEAPDDPAVQADDGSDDPAVQADDGSDDPAVQGDDGPDDPAVQADDASKDLAVQADDGPDDPAFQADDASDDPAVQAGDELDDPPVQEGDAPDNPAVQAGDTPDDTALQVDDTQSA